MTIPERDSRCVFVKKKRRSCNCKNGANSLICHTEKTPAVSDPPSCNSTASRPGAFAPRLPPTFSGSRPMADFRHTAFAVSVLPCAHSAVRGGFLPIPFRPPPDPAGSLQRQPRDFTGSIFTFPDSVRRPRSARIPSPPVYTAAPLPVNRLSPKTPAVFRTPRGFFSLNSQKAWSA